MPNTNSCRERGSKAGKKLLRFHFSKRLNFGQPFRWTMAEQNPCLEDQQDEITALSAIFDNDFSKREYEDCSTIYEIQVTVNIVGKKVEFCVWIPGEEEHEENEESDDEASSLKKIRFLRSKSRQHTCLTLSVSHLTPLRLEFSFPSDYPASTKPLYTLSCLWLDGFHLISLCKKLDELWEENLGQTVIFLWVDWLQNSLLEYFEANESISMKPYEWDGGDAGGRDPRGILEFLDPKSCALKILEYDFHLQQEEFRKETHTCEICYEEKEGIFFHHLDECGHTFCGECLLDYCQMHVNEGTVKLLKCPQKGCQASLSPIVLRQLLSDDDFKRWERLLFQQTLDGMVDVLYCPRCNAVVVRDEDDESMLAQCQACFFCFCVDCQMSWHSTQPCGAEDEQNSRPLSTRETKRRKARKKNGGKGQEEVPEDTVPLGRKNRKPGSSEMNYEFLMLQKRLGNYQRCPNCRIMVERISGCDMMCCIRCQQKFCWRCGKY